ncbi:macro domain-containing protein [Brevibacillus fluminis]|uniref:macro domain-containing protein n=1 Tax=Brevibacillus fluminis TaxID=511487 RepID=UPI003F89AB57
MTVFIKKGDLLKASENIIGHQVNCQGVMGSGIAKAIRVRYPEVYQQYREICEASTEKMQLLGICQLVHIKAAMTVANLFGQYNYGKGGQRYTDYEALHRALTSLKEQAARSQLTVALPYNIGCGLANGEWDVVEAMIEEVFSDYSVTLYRLD